MFNVITRSNQIKNLYQSGLTQKNIGEKLGLSSSQISVLMKKYGIISREAHFVHMPDSKLKEKIKSLYESGFSYKYLMKNYGYSEKLIRKCINGKARTHKEQSELIKLRNKHELNKHQKQLVLGSLLGDGCLIIINGSYMFQTHHGAKQKEYIEYKHKIMGSNQKLREIIAKSGFSIGNKIYRSTYQNKGALEEIAKIIFVNGKKYVNKIWLDQITEEGLAYWFMDDGYALFRAYYKNRPNNKKLQIYLYTQSYNLEEHNLLINMLKRFNITAKIHKCATGTKMILALSRESSDKFINMVKPYIEPIKCMHYKLKQSTPDMRFKITSRNQCQVI